MQQSKPPEGKPNPVINSFLNLCRVCPVPTDDKVNSEYKRNFTWHDGYQATKVDVVRNAPSLQNESPGFAIGSESPRSPRKLYLGNVGSSAEPSLSRKKKCPGQPAKDHPLYDKGEEGESSSESHDISNHHEDSRARSEDRFKGRSATISPRSRSADSAVSGRLRTVSIPDDDTRPSQSKMHDEIDSRKQEEKQPLMPSRGNPGTPGPPEEGGGVLPKTTEYRSQFVAWPIAPGESPGSTARKSASMGLIAASKKDAVDGDASSGELWNNQAPEDDDDAALDAVKRGRIKKTEYKAKFRPFSAYTYVDGSWKKATRLIKDRAVDDMDIYSSYSYPLIDGSFIDNESSEADQHAWYSEVVERLRKADQYRARSHTGAHQGSDHPTPEFFPRDRTILSPCSVASSSCRTWKDDRPNKERGRPGPVPVHHRKDKREAADILDYPKSRDGSVKKKPLVEKTTVRPKSAEPVIPVSRSEHKSPKRTRPRAPKDLPVKGHGDLSGRKKAHKQSASSPVGMKPRAVCRPHAAPEEGKVWLKPDASKDEEEDAKDKKETLVNGFASEDSEGGGGGKMVNGDGPEDYSAQYKMNGEHAAVVRGPCKVPLTTVKSPEEVTGVRSPDPESWTVPLDIGKGLHWMDGKTPDGVQTKGPPTLLSKVLKESSLVGKSQKDVVLCDPASMLQVWRQSVSKPSVSTPSSMNSETQSHQAVKPLEKVSIYNLSA